MKNKEELEASIAESEKILYWLTAVILCGAATILIGTFLRIWIDAEFTIKLQQTGFLIFTVGILLFGLVRMPQRAEEDELKRLNKK